MTCIRWGIAGAGMISSDFCLALKTLDAKHHCIKAVAARSKQRASEFADKLEIEKSYGSYDELFCDPDIDVIYVGTVNANHKDSSLKALENGKHVLCEKPAGPNSKDLEEILQKAKEKNLFFMEALATRFLPLYEEVEKTIKDGKIGDLKAVSVSFGFQQFQHVERIMNPALGGTGLMMDIGAYAVIFADMVFSGCMPDEIVAAGFSAPSGPDLTSSVTLLYSGQRMAQIFISGAIDLPNEATVFGSEGKIVVNAQFWAPSKVEINGETKEFSFPATKFPGNYPNSCGLRYQADHLRQCLLEKKLESDVVSHDTSRRLMKLLERIRESLKANK